MAEVDSIYTHNSMAGILPAVACLWKSKRTVAQYEPQPKRVGALNKPKTGGVIPMEKRKEYAEGEIITCPKCGGDDLDCEDAPEKGRCLTCGLEFTIRQVAIWEE